MSERLTPEWTETAAQAYGETGQKGDLGEQFFKEWLEGRGHTARLTPDHESQVQGIDIEIYVDGKSLHTTADIKNNLNASGSFAVETADSGWLFQERKTSWLIVHVNPAKNQVVVYPRRLMKHYIEKAGRRNTGLLWISLADINKTPGQSFIVNKTEQGNQE